VRSADGRIEDAIVVTANQRVADVIGCKVEALLDQPILAIVPKLRTTKAWSRYLEVVETRQPQRLELRLSHQGSRKWFDVKAVPLGDGFMLSIADITSLKSAYRELESRNLDLAKANTMLGEEVSRREALEGELRRLAEVDLLTGVATRRVFMDAAEQAISVASERRPLAIIGIDLDHFKCINDRYGHLAGDKILSAVGEELRRECRAPDVVGRLGGEEFAVLLSNTPLDAAARVAERILQRLRTAVVPISQVTCLSVTASIGVAGFVLGDAYEDLLGRADAALYRAKSAGRDRVVVAEPRPEPTNRDVGRVYAA
jgi:diguanylate cyclase (GGDEF)-like protein/PAS domain S-box-containing protein